MQRNILLIAVTLCIFASVANCANWIQIKPYTTSDCSDAMTKDSGIAFVLNMDATPGDCLATTSRWYVNRVPLYNATLGTAILRTTITPFSAGLPLCPSLTSGERYDITYITTNGSLCQPITSMLPNTTLYPVSNWGAFAKVEVATNSVIFLNNIKVANLGDIIRMALYNSNCTTVLGYYFVRRNYSHQYYTIDGMYTLKYNCNALGPYVQTCDGLVCFNQDLNTCIPPGTATGYLFWHQAGVCL